MPTMTMHQGAGRADRPRTGQFFGELPLMYHLPSRISGLSEVRHREKPVARIPTLQIAAAGRCGRRHASNGVPIQPDVARLNDLDVWAPWPRSNDQKPGHGRTACARVPRASRRLRLRKQRCRSLRRSLIKSEAVRGSRPKLEALFRECERLALDALPSRPVLTA